MSWVSSLLEELGFEVFTSIDQISQETLETCHMFVIDYYCRGSGAERFARERAKLIVSLYRQLPDILACARSEDDLRDIAIRVKPLCGEMVPPSEFVAEQLACIQAAYLRQRLPKR
jgi:hypothetical protein